MKRDGAGTEGDVSTRRERRLRAAATAPARGCRTTLTVIDLWNGYPDTRASERVKYNSIMHV